ncbi:MAG: carbon storage regulator CsrA [Thermoanaerobacteraceae bacterium]|nr:carbon storage regulator CsrA [Thermoanaerobacteraceae bacterium]
MLILTRKVDDGIVIGDNIKISVIAIEGSRVKLGISAPKNMPILREEIVEAVKQENMSAKEIDIFRIDFGLLKPFGEEGNKEVE